MNLRHLKLIPALATVAILAGCSSVQTANTSGPLMNTKGFKDNQWCFDNYSSASVSHKTRQHNAKFCDKQARNNYKDALARQEK